MSIRTQRMLTFGLLGLTMLAASLFGLPRRAEPGAVAAQGITPTPGPATGAVQRTVSVMGTGTTQVEPDVAVVVLGVQTDAETAVEALTTNSTQMEALMDALTGAGIAQADIRTQSIQLYPRYDATPPPDQPQPTPGAPANRLVGYTALNTVEARVRDLDSVGEVLDGAVAAGGNTIQNIYFDVTNQSAVMDDAREAAMQDAQRKAQQLATLAGATLGPVVAINESSRFPLPFERSAVALDQAQGGAVPIAPGQQTLTVDIQVTWELVVTETD